MNFTSVYKPVLCTLLIIRAINFSNLEEKHEAVTVCAGFRRGSKYMSVFRYFYLNTVYPPLFNIVGSTALVLVKNGTSQPSEREWRCKSVSRPFFHFAVVAEYRQTFLPEFKVLESSETSEKLNND